MVCEIAKNPPLTAMCAALGLEPQCHGLRGTTACYKGYRKPDSAGLFAMGIPGTAIGYCQALFNRVGAADEHSRRVIELLNEIEAPWSRSHEMFWAYRDCESAAEFIENGVRPLCVDGRVPIVITGLDPGRGEDMTSIREIVASRPAISEGETILIRVLLKDEQSFAPIAELLQEIFRDAQTKSRMPKWWPLLQGNIALEQWSQLERLAGDVWPYANVAVNPFTPPDMIDELADQITVAQVPIGLSHGVTEDGAIRLAPKMQIPGAAGGAIYSLPEYIGRLADLPSAPTLIILGPSQPEWTERVNQDRIRALLPHLKQACDASLWRELKPERRSQLWQLTA